MITVTHQVNEYLCDLCGVGVGNHVGNPFYRNGDDNYCPDCALKLGLIDAETWLHHNGIYIYHHAFYDNGKIIAYQKWGRGYRKDEVVISDG